MGREEIDMMDFSEHDWDEFFPIQDSPYESTNYMGVLTYDGQPISRKGSVYNVLLSTKNELPRVWSEDGIQKKNLYLRCSETKRKIKAGEEYLNLDKENKYGEPYSLDSKKANRYFYGYQELEGLLCIIDEKKDYLSNSEKWNKIWDRGWFYLQRDKEGSRVPLVTFDVFLKGVDLGFFDSIPPRPQLQSKDVE